MDLLKYLGFIKPELKFSLIIRGGVEVHELPNAPKGWDGALISHVRSDTYFGMSRKFTVPMDFVLDGAYLLRKEFYAYGIQAQVKMKVDKLDPRTQAYKQVYLGDVDFSQFKDTESIVTVNMMDAGIESAVKAYEGTDYEIPLDVYEAVTVTLTPLELVESADLVLLPPGQDVPTSSFLQLSVVNNEQRAADISVQDVMDNIFVTNPDFSTSANWFFRANNTTTVTFKDSFISLKARDGGNNAHLNIGLYNQNGAEVLTIIDVDLSNNEQNYNNISLDFTFNAQAGDRLYLYAKLSGTNIGFYQVTDGSISMSYTTVSPPTTCKALTAGYVYNYLMQAMWKNGNELLPGYPTRSNLLNNQWKQLVITSGDGIRKVPGAKLKLSWSTFWQAINSQLNAEWGNVNGTAELEGKANAFKSQLPVLSLGEINDFDLEVYSGYMFNTIKVGYEEQTYDEINGKYEVNSEQNYTSPITRIQKELNLVSEIRADAYGIEYLRVNLEGKNSTDSDSDSDNFFVYLNSYAEADGTYKPETTAAYPSIAGVPVGYYNIKLSPKHMLFRHGSFIRSVMDKLDAGRLLFASALKNTDMSLIDGGKLISERANVEISSLDDKLFLPYTVTVKAKLPLDALAKLDSLLNGYVSFTHDDGEYRGFILEANVDIAKNSSQEFKLLLTADNNLSGLIK